MRLTGSKITKSILYILPVLSLIEILLFSISVVDKVVLIAMFALHLILLFCIATKIKKKEVFVFLGICVISFIITYIFYGGIGIALKVFNLLSACIVYNGLELDNKTFVKVHFANVICVILSFLFVNIEKPYGAYWFYIFGTRINANTIGLLAVAGILHLFIAYDAVENKSWKKNVIIAVIFVYFCAFLFMSNCRTGIVALIAFIVMVFLIKRPFRYKNFKKLATFLLVFGLIFPLIYLFFYEYLEDVTILNKSLFSGREIVWLDTIKNIFESPIFGTGNSVAIETVGNTTTESAHNFLLGIWTNMGIIPTIVVVCFFVNNFSRLDENGISRIGQIALLCGIIIGFFENAFTSTLIYVYLTSLMLYRRKSNNQLKQAVDS